MSFLKAFGSYLPTRTVTNAEIAAMVGCDSDWIYSVSGIAERRFAREETIVDMALAAARQCLERAGETIQSIKLLIVTSGSYDRLFPGPAVTVAARLGIPRVPAVDLPLPSAGSLFSLAIADRLALTYGNVLVVATEKMSSVVLKALFDRNVAILFGDGAGAALVGPDGGLAEIMGSLLFSDGSFSEELWLGFDRNMEMNGRMVILQASRKIPAAILELLQQHGIAPGSVDVFLMHQANQNLILRVARSLGVAPEKFYSNLSSVGNTSSASMLIASAEWSAVSGFRKAVPVVFAGFGAGFHWGALVARGV